MKALIPQFTNNTNRPYYLQLYDYIKDKIVSNEVTGNEKLPSIRGLATEIKVSVTTINLAYQQLMVEGYIYSKPKSGYYISPITTKALSKTLDSENYINSNPVLHENFEDVISLDESEYLFDSEAFDFIKWKKALSTVLNNHSDLLLSEGNPQGEYSLRYEIQKYLYQVRGIDTRPQNIVIGAGTQQITGQLSKILLVDNISDLVIEKPGYTPAYNIFADYGLTLHGANVEKDGISLEYIPKDRRSAIYTSPSNQFPTGAVMSAGKRYDLLHIVDQNNSYIIEEDYDSELRYFGQPVPPLKSLDERDTVIYLSSFSSTLFPAVKISYMVLPNKLSIIFDSMKGQYTQTCSKTEQLALAYYMEGGYYHTNVRKLRRLYAQKLQIAIDTFKKYASKSINLIHSSSGVNMLIEIKTDKTPFKLWEIGKTLGISTEPVSYENDHGQYPRLILHFYKIPMEKIEESLKKLIHEWI